MKAKIIYDIQKYVEIYSVENMKKFFKNNTLEKNSSPSVNNDINDVEAIKFIVNCVIMTTYNNPSCTKEILMKFSNIKEL